MKIFIDTANIYEIKKANELGIISGVTTNPTLLSKENRDYKEIIKEITKVINAPISVEVLSTNYQDMIEEAIDLVNIHHNIVIKIPMCEDGLKAVKILSEKEIETNVTLIFSTTQALLAARAGATYVSPFIGRLDDIGNDGISMIKEINHMFKINNINTKIISASIRSVSHVDKCSIAGSDIATIPYHIIKKMIYHPLTEQGIKKFIEDSKNIIKGE